MGRVTIKRFDAPDETRSFPMGRFAQVTLGGVTLGQASYDPGWKWSKHVGKSAGCSSCDVEHVGVVVSGRVKVLMQDGEEVELRAGDIFHVPPGHDSRVVGDEPYVSLHLTGAAAYAR